MYFIMFMLFLTACTSSSTEEPVQKANAASRKCGRPAILLYNNQVWLEEDENMLKSFEIGCVKHYSSYHCPLKVFKTDKLSYRIICQKN